MKIIRAQHLGMCFGVRDAIHLAQQTAAQRPLTIFGDLVHNANVVNDLRRQGIRIETAHERLQTPTVMITAHGASQKAIERLEHDGRAIVEATCPLVKHAHRAAAELVRQGFFPVVIGKPGHVEVRGLTEDLAEFAILHSEEDLDQIPDRPKFGVVAQTTQPVDRVGRLYAALQRRFPHSAFRLIDTVCLPTKQRQTAAEELARQCTAVVVVGGSHSNNTRELVATCQKFCSRVFHIEHASQLREEWFLPEDTVGLTAGTSTPDLIIDSVEAALSKSHAPNADNPLAQPVECVG